MSVLDRFMDWVAGEEEEPPEELPSAEEASSVSARNLTVFLEQLDDKLDRTVQDFADGIINRAQFENLYRHYQNQRRVIQGYLQQRQRDPGWLENVKPGESTIIRRQYAARVLAYSVYGNETSLPLHTFGDFPLESELVVGFLSGFRSASTEILGAGAQKTVAEDGKVLVYIPGQDTTLIILYSSEPAEVDILGLRQAHQHFETVNQPVLLNKPIDASALLFVYDLYLTKSKPGSKQGGPG
jgi:hypothetical protein